MRCVSPARREFVTEVSFVALGSANSIRGVLVGDIGLAIGGLVLMALIVADLAFGPVLVRAYFRVFRHRPGRRALQVLRALFAVAIIADFAGCVASCSRRDWGGGLFYGVRTTAEFGVVTGISARLSVRDAVETSEHGPTVTAAP